MIIAGIFLLIGLALGRLSRSGLGWSKQPSGINVETIKSTLNDLD
jgi:hypothetical protein